MALRLSPTAHTARAAHRQDRSATAGETPTPLHAATRPRATRNGPRPPLIPRTSTSFAGRATARPTRQQRTANTPRGPSIRRIAHRPTRPTRFQVKRGPRRGSLPHRRGPDPENSRPARRAAPPRAAHPATAVPPPHDTADWQRRDRNRTQSRPVSNSPARKHQAPTAIHPPHFPRGSPPAAASAPLPRR